jgi:hypothetical protein
MRAMRANARTHIVDRPARADEVWDTERKKCLRQSGELILYLLLVGDHGRKTGVGKDQARNLTHAENFFSRQEAIRSEYPPGLVRCLVEKRVSSIVDHVILLIDDQHRELERIARLDALHPTAAAQNRKVSLHVRLKDRNDCDASGSANTNLGLSIHFGPMLPI